MEKSYISFCKRRKRQAAGDNSTYFAEGKQAITEVDFFFFPEQYENRCCLPEIEQLCWLLLCLLLSEWSLWTLHTCHEVANSTLGMETMKERGLLPVWSFQFFFLDDVSWWTGHLFMPTGFMKEVVKSIFIGIYSFWSL